MEFPAGSRFEKLPEACSLTCVFILHIANLHAQEWYYCKYDGMAVSLCSRRFPPILAPGHQDSEEEEDGCNSQGRNPTFKSHPIPPHLIIIMSH